MVQIRKNTPRRLKPAQDLARTLDAGLFKALGDPTRLLASLADLFSRAKDEGIGPDDLQAYARDLGAGARAAARGGTR